MEKVRLKSFEEFAATLSKEDQDLFEQLSIEYLTAFERMRGPRAEQVFKQWRMTGVPAGGAGGVGVPPGGAGAPPGGAGGGDGFDDDEFNELNKRIQTILGRMRKGIDVDSMEIVELMGLFAEARRRFREIMGGEDAATFEELEK